MISSLFVLVGCLELGVNDPVLVRTYPFVRFHGDCLAIVPPPAAGILLPLGNVA